MDSPTGTSAFAGTVGCPIGCQTGCATVGWPIGCHAGPGIADGSACRDRQITAQ